MPGQIAFTSLVLEDGKLTATGNSTAPENAELVLRHVVVQQDGVFSHGPADQGEKGWNAGFAAADFQPGAAVATGTETYLRVDDGVPLFSTFTWIEHMTIQAG